MDLKVRAGSIPARGTENQAIMSKFHSRFFVYGVLSTTNVSPYNKLYNFQLIF